jgi:DNA-binding transcriptional LysR family regulator
MRPGLNLLRTLDILLAEGSVARAARKLRLSPSAMSRTLARLREVTGDQLLVRAGRGLVPTVRAIEMREQVRSIVEDAQSLLQPRDELNLSALQRTFTLRTSDGFAETFGQALIRKVHEEAPGVQLRFVRKLDKESAGLREGSIDLETGVVAGPISPEVRAQLLFTDRYVGVVSSDHPLVRRKITPQVYASWPHIVAWRPGLDLGEVDEMLVELSLRRSVMTTVDGFATALALCRGSELIATVPEKHTAALREGMHTFTLPLPVKDFTLSLLWHPRVDGDPAQRWLRETVREACRSTLSER